MGGRRNGRVRGDEGGFTLVELLVVILILGVVGGLFTMAMVDAFRTQRGQMSHVDALNDAKLALERLTRDVRAANPIQAANADSIEVLLDPTGTPTTRTYKLEADGATRRLVVCDTDLASCTGGARKPLIDDVSSGYDMFTYRDEHGAVVTSADAVHVVEIDVRITRPENQAEVRLSDEVTLRNQES